MQFIILTTNEQNNSSDIKHKFSFDMLDEYKANYYFVICNNLQYGRKFYQQTCKQRH